jgi:16S rRNA (uracil1498-N3)-methyltransferase
MSDPSIRLFVEAPLHPGADVPLTESQAHYLGNVMRLQPGAEVLAFNGADGEWRARVARVARKSATLEAIGQTRTQEAEPDCWLCFALLKRNKTDFAVEKATELGVSVIQPVITDRTQADHVNLDRLRAIAIEAAEQCARLAAWPVGRALYLADERRTAKFLRPSPAPAALLIGPEGGFTGAEIAAIGCNPHVTRVSLGRRILRAETAAIAGLALLLASDPPEEEQLV